MYEESSDPIQQVTPPTGNTHTEILQRLNDRWPVVQEYWKDDHEWAREDQRFRNGEHWPEQIARQRKLDDRPCMVINRTENFIDQVTGDQRQNRPQIKVRPEDGDADPIVAKIYTGLIKNIEYQSMADVHYDNAFDQAVGNGFGYFQFKTVYTDPKSFDQEIRVEGVDSCFSVFLDPHGRYGFVVERMPLDEFKRNYPKSDMTAFERDTTERKAAWLNNDSIQLADYWERRPVIRELNLLSDGSTMWADETNDAYLAEKGLTVITSRDSEDFEVWFHRTNGFEILEEKKWAGKFIPIVGVYGKMLNLDGQKIHRGLIRWAKDPIRMLDYARSAAAESLAIAPKTPWVAEEGQLENHEDEWRDANKTNTSVLAYKKVEGVTPPQRTQPAMVATGAFTEAKAAEEDLEAVVGIYKAGLGAPSNERSGIAQRERKRESDTGNFAYVDNLSRALVQAGKILVDLIPKIYDSERIIRIMGLDEKEQFVLINKEMNEEEAGKYGMEKAKGGAFYDLSVGKYDVKVTTGPSYSTQRREASEGMISFVGAVPEAGAATMDLIAEAQDWPNADKIAKRLRKMLPEGMAEPEDDEEQEEQEPQGPTPAEQLEAEKLEIEKAKLNVEMEKLEVEKLKIAADLEKSVTEGEGRTQELIDAALMDFAEGIKEGPGAQA